MTGFTYENGELHADEIAVAALAEELGTPTYVYSAPAVRDAYRRVRDAFAPLGARLHYAVKASPNLHLCRLLGELGAGMDVVSGGELERAWLSGAAMDEIVFAGVGKTDAEIRAALDGRFSPLSEEDARRFRREGIADRGPVGLFNAESESELRRLAAVAAELGTRARASIRVNPDVDARTHEYTTTGKEENKFGIELGRVPELFAAYAESGAVDLQGLHVHIGSPVNEVGPFVAAVEVLCELIDEIARGGQQVRVLDLGGGWPVDYYDGEAPPIEDYAARIVPLLAARVEQGLKVILEPGRSILANAGVLLTQVQHVKRGRAKTFVVCDAGMHTLIRPALYRAFHFAWPVRWEGEVERAERPDVPGLVECDLVGPICETGDFLARGRPLPPLAQGDLVAVFSAGAYGMSMASNYNDHGRPAEVLVDGRQATVINERQALADLLATERTVRELAVGLA